MASSTFTVTANARARSGLSTHSSRQFDGVPIGGREGRLKWFSIDALPFEEMWEDDQYWHKIALEGTKFEAWFYYSGDFEKLIDRRIESKSLPNQIEA